MSSLSLQVGHLTFMSLPLFSLPIRANPAGDLIRHFGKKNIPSPGRNRRGDGRMAGAKVGAPAGHRIAEMGTKSRRFLCLWALSLFLLPATAAAWSGKVVSVIDGDSITVLH